MATTKIEWANRVWNPITGCTKISAGCAGCYAQRMASRLQGRCGYDEKEPFKVTVHENKWEEPLKWRKPSIVFVCSMGDLFHKDVPQKAIDKVFAIAALKKDHKFLILTKRPGRMHDYFNRSKSEIVAGWEDAVYEMGICGDKESQDSDTVAAYLFNRCESQWPLENIALGVSVEDQTTADVRIAYLNCIPAAIKFVSCEPLLSSINFEKAIGHTLKWHTGGMKNCLSWVIVGGETGPKARPMHPDWVRSIREQCKEAGVPMFFKSWGEYKPGSDYINLKSKNHLVLNNGKYARWDNDDWKSITKDYSSAQFAELSGNVMHLCGKKYSGAELGGELIQEFPEGWGMVASTGSATGEKINYTK